MVAIAVQKSCSRSFGISSRLWPSRRPVWAGAQAPERAFDRAEEERLKSTDAFAELVKFNKNKQSVNRPQKVRYRGADTFGEPGHAFGNGAKRRGKPHLPADQSNAFGTVSYNCSEA
jgi:hypothetical protein